MPFAPGLSPGQALSVGAKRRSRRVWNGVMSVFRLKEPVSPELALNAGQGSVDAEAEPVWRRSSPPNLLFEAVHEPWLTNHDYG